MERVKENIFHVGVRDWHRRLFDELIPLPEGTSYNAYLIIGSEKTALIDTVDPSKREEFIENLKEVNPSRIDFVISNHSEQDHSGCIPDVLKLYPDAKVLTNEKGKNFLMDLLHIPEEKFTVIKDGEEISLGNKTLKFIFFPWVHWPETMLTFLKEDRILFTCDLFGSHLASSSLYARDEHTVLISAKRYFAEIMMPFRDNISKRLNVVKELNPEIIAPSHGPIYDRPELIINAYEEWISDKLSKKALILYVSMHGSTERMVRHLVKTLIYKGFEVKEFNLTVADLGEIAIELVDASTVVIGSPAFLTGFHPIVAGVTSLINALRPKTKFVGFIGSYSWGAKLFDQLKEMLKNLKAEFLEPVFIKGLPRDYDLKSIEKLAEKIVEVNGKL